MSASILDVAQHCNVSPGIAGRVLNAFQDDISDELRGRVLDAAKELGYIASPHTRNLGVLFMDESAKGLTHPFFASVLNAFKISAESSGYDVTFINHCIGSDVLTYLEYCQVRNLDGVCIACIDFSDPQVVELGITSGRFINDAILALCLAIVTPNGKQSICLARKNGISGFA